MQSIWSRNATLPPRTDKCAHELISERVEAQPDAPAVFAHDGEFSYRQLHNLSDRLAWRIRDAVAAGTIVPLCFEKSALTAVAALAVLKAGGAFVLLDVSQPEARLQSIVDQTRAAIICSSTSNHELSSRLVGSLDRVVTIAAGGLIFNDLAAESKPFLSEVNPTSTCYVVFTSGSTGNPKGVAVSHSNICSAFRYQLDSLGFDIRSRVFDFASASFDVAVHNLLATLVSGGCLCVPSEAQRVQDPAASMAAMKVTVANLTPSVARLIDPENVPTLETLIFLGEALSRREALRWTSRVRIINTYGPAEATPISTINSSLATVNESSDPSIGGGVGVLTWVVDPENHNSLLPPGEIGELLLEGPIVSDFGYLNDPATTSGVFIESPRWLSSTRQSRLYKTGDLVQYRKDGNLQFRGRKDGSQVKINGMRVELGEVEHHVHACLPDAVRTVVELIALQTHAILVAFIQSPQLQNAATHGSDVEAERDSRSFVPDASVADAISSRLPGYMIPNKFIMVSEIPRTPTGKTDRKRLRSMAESLGFYQPPRQTVRRPPVSEMERTLHSLWSQLFVVDPETIGLDDEFLGLGGDSLAAIRLAAAARKVGIELQVADIFSSPTLEAHAQRARASRTPPTISPFALVEEDVELDAMAESCGTGVSNITDVYPCTPLQQGLFASTMQRPSDYILQTSCDISDLDIEAVKSAWERVYQAVQILRTRIIELGSSLVQAVVNEDLIWQYSTNLEDHLQQDMSDEIGLGLPLARFALVGLNHEKPQHLVMTLHHSVFDSWSLDLLMNKAREFYSQGSAQRKSLNATTEFNAFVQYVETSRNDAAAEEYWRNALAASEPVQFPSVNVVQQRYTADSRIIRTGQIPGLHDPTGVTPSIMIRTALAIVLSRYTQSEDVVFGVTVSGRNAPVSGVESIIGPTIATVPVRVRFQDSSIRISRFMAERQTQATEMIRYEQYGLQHISKLSEGASRACDFQTLLVVQPLEIETADGPFERWQTRSEQIDTYALIIECSLLSRGVKIDARYNHDAIDTWRLQRLLGQFEHVIKQLTQVQSEDLRLSDIDMLPDPDMDFISRINADVPQPIERCVHELFEEQVRSQPTDHQAVSAADGTLTYGELDMYSARLAHLLSSLGVGPGSFVPLCFEKTLLVVVSVLAVLKAGAAFVPLEPSLPLMRRQDMLDELQPTVILSSKQHSTLFEATGCQVLTLDLEFLKALHSNQPIAIVPASPEDIAYILFTSGTTGKPKGVVLEHKAVSSSCTRHGELLGFDESLRVLQFSSYMFDACIAEIFTTLIFGGCICIPSDEDRMSNLSKAINEMHVNWMFLTPAVARTIDPDSVKCVKTIAIGGEKFSNHDAERWARDGRRVFLVYGPTECAIYCTAHDLSRGIDSSLIGKSIGSAAWIVDPQDHNRLAPVGTIGELCVDGPILARGYLNDAQKTAESFIEDPVWLGRIRPRSKAHVRRRLYKTGDLVEHTSLADGTLRYIGRKDSQTKIHGQRLELSEVEYHVRQCISAAREVVAEVITPAEDASNQVLIAFVANEIGPRDRRSRPLEETIETTSLPPDTADLIAQRMPAYMVPSAYFFVYNGLPRKVSSSKTDRQRLREVGRARFTDYHAQLATSEPITLEPSNETERQLRRIWSKVLNLDESKIGLGSNWYRLGGDSISSISLVSEARKYGIALTVSTILKAPTLRAQASLQQNAEYAEETTIPFSLLGQAVDAQALCEDLALSCEGIMDSASIEDAYPCTPMQEGLMSLASKRPGDYILQNVLKLPADLRMDAFEAAWQHTVRSVPILRTRIVQHSEIGLLQIVLRDDFHWVEREEQSGTFLKADKIEPMNLGQSLSRYTILTHHGIPQCFIWTIHHSLYDGVTLPLIGQLAEQHYLGRVPPGPLRPFSLFVKHILQHKGTKAEDYWRETLSNNESSQFPPLPAHVKEPAADTTLERIAEFRSRSARSRQSGFSSSDVVRAALAFVVSRYTGEDDVVFGTTTSGRTAPIAGISEIAGPTISTVPFRIHVSRGDDATVQALLTTVQQQTLDTLPYEQMGLQNIARIHKDAHSACQFQTLLVMQTSDDDLAPRQAFGTWRSEEQLGFNTYAITFECFPAAEGLRIRARFDSAVISVWNMERLLGQLIHVAQQFASAETETSMSLNDVGVMPFEDDEILTQWNGTPKHAAVERCVHDMIQEQARIRGSAMAVEGHDGNFSYEQLDFLTDRLAQHLSEHGVGPEVIVPLCFTKSAWTIVALLGVLKAGGAFVLLDPNHPSDRLQMLCKKTGATIALALPTTANKIEAFVDKVILVDQAIADWLPPLPATTSIRGSPDTTAYVIFTSGSTGVPKGCLIEHRSYCSTAVNHGSVMTMSHRTRTLQFGSYSFAGAIMEILMTLIHGGCVCVPTDEERLSQLDRAICRLDASWAFLTSSVLSALTPQIVPCLKTICIGGEAIHAAQITQWAPHVHLRQTYGSAETAAVVSSARLTEDASTSDVGQPTTGRYWIVDAADVNRLAPLGAVGECVIEGPTIGREYLDEPEKTVAAFIKAPGWRERYGVLQTGSRFYRTGDLATYTADGAIQLLGRIDSQVKLRGQRIELGEIEHQARSTSIEVAEIAVERAIPKGADVKAAMLVAFIVLRKTKNDSPGTDDNRSRNISSLIAERLLQVLPQYMVPAVFLVLPEMPKTISKKTDRKRLREMASDYTRQELIDLSSMSAGEKQQPTTVREKELQQLWSRLLDVETENIGVEDDFFAIGGDSVSALQLVAEARKVDFPLNMADVFHLRTLSAQAQVGSASQVQDNIPPFSLLEYSSMNQVEQLRQQLAKAMGVRSASISDAYPCTPLQIGMLSHTLRTTGEYTLQNVLHLSEDVSLEDFKSAWEQAVKTIAILRTRIVQNDDFGHLQVVVEEPLDWHYHAGDLESFLLQDRLQSMELGTRLCRFTLVGEEQNNPKWFVWTAHHATYDGVSVGLVLDIVREVYLNKTIPRPRQFAPFIKYVQGVDQAAADAFWEAELLKYDTPAFPPLPKPLHKPTADTNVKRSCTIPKAVSFKTSLPTLIRAALAIVIGRHSMSDDILFGTVLSGRNAPVPQVEEIVAPTLATVPVRVELPSKQTVSEYIDGIQRQAIDMIPFEQYGLQNIARNSKAAVDFQTLLVIQPASKKHGLDDEPFGTWITDQDQHGFTTYGLTLQCSLPSADEGIEITASFDSAIISSWEVEKMLDHFEMAVAGLITAKPQNLVSEIDLLTPRDRGAMWQRNKNIPARVNQCVHDLIRQRAKLQPNELAVTSWDGQLTYSELDRCSDDLARHLYAIAGQHSDSVIPICFEKSTYTVVAMLAAMKAGFGSVTFDITQPVQRLQTIVAQLDPPLILCSVTQTSLAVEILPARTVVPVGEDELVYISQRQSHAKLPIVSPDHTLCVLFTSGSTGIPKGAAITHSNFASGIEHQSTFFGHDQGTRVYAFASYSFDISWFDTLHALASGSTLYVPSESERKNDLEGSLFRSRATAAFLTPSVARLIRPEAVPSLRLLALGGEPQRWSDFSAWPDNVKKLSVYGPAECTVVSSAEDASILQRRDMTLPSSLGLNAWLVDVANEQLLAANGCVGEIWLEGPLVGSGYVGDEKRTALSFVEDPQWLIAGGGPIYPGRGGRLYRTGDLARFMPDGSMAFVGRKDNQRKIRGQRIELAEIERHVRQVIGHQAKQVVAEIVGFSNAKDSSTLVVFVETGTHVYTNGSTGPVDSALSRPSSEMTVMHVDSKVVNELSMRLPSYMVPQVYFEVSSIPRTVNGKTDRAKLKALGSRLSTEELMRAAYPLKTIVQPSTTAEITLRRLLAEVLNTNPDGIGIDDNVFQIGADSITAMKLVSKARRTAVVRNLTVTDVFRQPTIRELALLQLNPDDPPYVDEGSNGVESTNEIDLHAISGELASNYGSTQSIQDAYPCTPLQEGLLSLTMKRNGDYVMQSVLELKDSNDFQLEAFKKAWEETVRSTDILRTIVIQHGEHGLIQVVLQHEPIAWKWRRQHSIDIYLEADKRKLMQLGHPLTRFAFVGENSNLGPRYFVWTIHHALYDGRCLPMMMEKATQTYQRLIDPFAKRSDVVSDDKTDFKSFVRYVKNKQSVDTDQYWISTLAASKAVPFPDLPPSISQPIADQTVEHFCHLPSGSQRKLQITVSSLLRGALALLIGRHTGLPEATFGAIVSGRNAPVPGIEHILGPTIATVPVRTILPNTTKTHDYLIAVQNAATEMIEYEQTGLQNILKLNEDTRNACEFQTLLVVQPPRDISVDQRETDVEQYGRWLERADQEGFTSYALTLECAQSSEGIAIRATFDSQVIETWRTRHILTELSFLVQQLAEAPLNSTVADISSLSAEDCDMIWSRNAQVPRPIERCVHDGIIAQVDEQPDAIAVNAHDGILTYDQLYRLASQVAYQLVDSGVVHGTIVPLCFEKSAFAVVALLGVVLAGGAFVHLDPETQPEARLQSIVEQSQATIICTSVKHQGIRKRLGTETIVVGPTFDQPERSSKLPRVDPSAPLYLVFTSGSTGQPKGCCLTHKNVASALHYQLVPMTFTKETRCYDFASYSFDVAIHNALATLTAGGCLLVPSDTDRKNRLAASMEEFGANHVSLTSSVARFIDPHDVPSLKTIMLGGEAVTQDVVDRWWGKVNLINSMGPAENTSVSILNATAITPSAVTAIGRGAGTITWVVDPGDHNNLLPIGATGELCLEGPNLGSGYLNDPERTAAAFINDPKWLVAGSDNHAGRSGRIYKSGDLVRYNEDGSLQFIGRKDTQVKVHGQRIELEEVEHHVRKSLPDAKVVADVLEAEHGSSNALIAFICFTNVSGQTRASVDRDTIKRIPAMASRLIATLSRHLPPYMVPSIYVPLDAMPMTATDKLDRRGLKELMASLSREELAQMRGAHGDVKKEPPETGSGLRLRTLWSQLLDIAAADISRDDDFFKLGGDSISAMKLVGLGNKKGMQFSVADVFETRTIAGLVDRMRTIDPTTGLVGMPLPTTFSLVDESTRQGILAALERHIQVGNVADILPLTDFQRQTIAHGIAFPTAACNYFWIDLGMMVNAARMQESCQSLLQLYPLLRSIFVDYDSTYWQIVLQECTVPFSLVEAGEDLDASTHRLCSDDCQRALSIQEIPTAFTLVQSRQQGYRLIIRLSHAQYDGISLPIILESLSDLYHQRGPDDGIQFSKYLASQLARRAASISYWKERLAGSQIGRLPLKIDSRTSPQKILATSYVPSLPLPDGILSASLIGSAWALVLSSLVNEDDLVFGHLIAGRDAGPAGIEDVAGPCVAIVPIRVRFQAGKSTSLDVITSVQEQLRSLQKHSSMSGWSDIIQSSTDWQDSTMQSIVQHQNIDEHAEIQIAGTAARLQWFENPVAPPPTLGIASYPERSGLKIEVRANSQLMTAEAAEALVGCVRDAMTTLADCEDKPIPVELRKRLRVIMESTGMVVAE